MSLDLYEGLSLDRIHVHYHMIDEYKDWYYGWNIDMPYNLGKYLFTYDNPIYFLGIL